VKVLNRKESQLTVEGVTTGTPAYMAPEVALGKAYIDGAADLYGLGCVAYWLTTGKLVFEETSATAMLLAHVQKAPVPPSERSEVAVPASLERAIMMCLAKEPSARPASAEALAHMLESSGSMAGWTREHSETWWGANIPDAIHSEADATTASITVRMSGDSV
jgi:serine/threonine protein kinase